MNYSLQNMKDIFASHCGVAYYPCSDGNNIPHFPEMFKYFFEKSVKTVKHRPGFCSKTALFMRVFLV